MQKADSAQLKHHIHTHTHISSDHGNYPLKRLIERSEMTPRLTCLLPNGTPHHTHPIGTKCRKGITLKSSTEMNWQSVKIFLHRFFFFARVKNSSHHVNIRKEMF